MAHDSFKENVVIITGASSGIGRELALQLASQGAWLILASRNIQALNDVADGCEQNGGRVYALQTDVSSEDQCRRLIDETVRVYGRIDTLINNAGFGSRGRLDELADLETFKKVMDVNFRGTLYCTYYALPYLKQSNGRIVNVSSVLGKVAAWGGTAYCSSKFAMAGFTDALRNEMAGESVTVTGVYPGYIITNFAGNVVKQDGSRMGDEGMKLYTSGMMTAQACASKIIKAAAKRKREIVLTGLGRFAVFLNRVSPKLVDWLALRIQKQRLRREQS